jgi:RNA polymerase sigma factor (sigma-70 family)
VPEDAGGEMNTHQITENLFRSEGARILASLVAHLGPQRLQLAEDVVQEALVRALQTWPYRGLPDNPAAWLTQTAKNLALDSIRREKSWAEKEPSIAAAQERWLSSSEVDADEHLPDDTLRMLFVCFHPMLSVEAQTALALRTVCGLSPAEIAAAFLTSEASIAKRLVRARQRIRELDLPFVVPGPNELPERLEGVLGALYLLFNEGYKASSGDSLVRMELCGEALRLTQLLADHPLTKRPGVHALVALMCLNASRLAARTDVEGRLVRLYEQDRTRWDAGLIQRGLVALADSAVGGEISAYHLEAGIAAVHSTALSSESTDWQRILHLYDQLLLLKPSPIIAMNRAVAVGRVHGPKEGLAALDAIRDQAALEPLHLCHMIRASFAMELGPTASALPHLRKAAACAHLPAEQAFIAAELERLKS